jgi:hypothetical protein
MTRFAQPRRWLAFIAVAGIGAGCGRPAPESHADAVALAACRRHADAVYAIRDPDAVFRQDTYVSTTRDAPFTGQGTAGVPSAGLSDEYERERMVSDCVRDTGAAPEAPPPEERPAQP